LTRARYGGAALGLTIGPAEEDPFVEDQAKEERSLVPRYMYGNMYGYEGSDQEYNSSEEFENFLNQPVHVDNEP
jgi:hypothetical protein